MHIRTGMPFPAIGGKLGFAAVLLLLVPGCDWSRQGENGWFYIAQQQDRLLADGDSAGVAMWRRVGERFERLTENRADNARAS